MLIGGKVYVAWRKSLCCLAEKSMLFAEKSMLFAEKSMLFKAATPYKQRDFLLLNQDKIKIKSR